jgi:hypothetical protein
MTGWARMLVGAATLAWSGAAAAAPAPAHYHIKAKFDVKAQTVAAEVAITLSPQEALDPVGFVISDRIKLEALDGGPGSHARVEPSDKPFKGLSRITFTYDRPPTRPVTLRFRYSGPVNGDDGHARIDPSQGIEVGFEDMWAPVRPNFSLVFTADADIAGIPSSQIVVAQGQVSHRGDHLIIHRPFTDIDMPFAALSGLQRSAESGAEVYARNPTGVLETAWRKYAGRIVEYYVGLFGPLPPQSLPERLVVLPRVGAAYARRAYISMPDGADEVKRMGPLPDWMLVATVSHEFAHAWWCHGDPLTEDHWLNESMAEYSSMRFTESIAGADALKVRIDKKIEPSRTAGPILGKGRPSKAALYQKGPLLLFDLDHRIGRVKMDELLGMIGRREVSTTAQFLAALTKVAGPEVATAFEAELRKP